MEELDDDVDDGISCGVERNRFRKLPTIFKMTSTEKITDNGNDDVDGIKYGVRRNRFKGLPSIYEMTLTKPKMENPFVPHFETTFRCLESG